MELISFEQDSEVVITVFMSSDEAKFKDTLEESVWPVWL